MWELICLPIRAPPRATPGKAAGFPDNPLPSRGRTFQSTSSGAAYVGGICSLSRGGGVNEVSSVGAWLGWGWRERGFDGHEPGASWRRVDIFVLHLPHPKYDNMGAMAVTLAQTLGQNLGMMWNKHRSSAGISEDPMPSPDPHPTTLEVKRVPMGGGQPFILPLNSPGSPLRGLQMSGQLAGLHHGGHWVSSWGQIGGESWAGGVQE